MTNKKKEADQQKKEIVYHIVNSLLAGGLVFLGSLTNGELNLKGIVFSFLASAIVCFTQFKKYWDSQESEYTAKVGFFNLIG